MLLTCAASIAEVFKFAVPGISRLANQVPEAFNKTKLLKEAGF
jgi:hypothetical protein